MYHCTFIWAIRNWFSWRDSCVKVNCGLQTSHHQAWKMVDPDSGGTQPKNLAAWWTWRGEGSPSSKIILGHLSESQLTSFDTQFREQYSLKQKFRSQLGEITYDFQATVTGIYGPFFCTRQNTLRYHDYRLPSSLSKVCETSNQNGSNDRSKNVQNHIETRNSIRLKTLINRNLWFKSPIIVSLTKLQARGLTVWAPETFFAYAEDLSQK